MMDFQTLCHQLEAGEIRVAEKVGGQWEVNAWIKEAILEGFRIGKLKDLSEGGYSFSTRIPSRSIGSPWRTGFA